MAIQFGTVDGLVNISNDTILCFAKGIEEFVTQGGPAYARREGISYGGAFQRFIEPVYADRTKPYSLISISQPVLTRSGSEQSPARGTFCKKMGLLKIDETLDLFEITPLGKAIIDNEISIKEYAFILLSKMGVFKDGVYVGNLLNLISIYFQSHATISQNSLGKYVKLTYKDSDIVKTRLDIIINSLVVTGLLTKITNDIYVLSGTREAELLIDYSKHSCQLNKAIIDTSKEYSDYIGSLDYGGVLDILTNDNKDVYIKFFPNLLKYMKSDNIYKNLQQIFYGAPGTGKSHEIYRLTEGKNVIRTTFHPDSDYSSFVGCYKPHMEETDMTTVIGETLKIVRDEKGEPQPEKRIVYKYSCQAFLQAYMEAWAHPESLQYLVIEEINRGNCAQIFGDIFQLLDRNDEGYSCYPIKSDTEMEQELKGIFDKKWRLTDELTHEIDRIYQNHYPNGITKKIKNGSLLLLPKNLYIWATMNTSDQSLFPIDSAFKRRWDWVYMPIDTKKENWHIKVGESYYSWTQFLDKVNDELLTDETAEDKHLGFYFCKAEGGKISQETFVGKVLFYLWNDVFKVYGIPSMIGSSKDWPYRKFYQTDGKVDVEKVAKLMEQLKITPEGSNENKEEALEDQ